MKKITTLVLSLVLVLAMSITAFAATPSKDILDALEKAGVSGEYYNQADSYLASHEVTAEQAKEVVAQINEASAKVGGKIDVSKLTAEQKSAIKGNVQAAASAIGLKATFDNGTVTIADAKTGDVVYTTGSSVIKPTGATTTATVAGIAVLAMGLVACGVAVSKKRFA